MVDMPETSRLHSVLTTFYTAVSMNIRNTNKNKQLKHPSLSDQNSVGIFTFKYCMSKFLILIGLYERAYYAMKWKILYHPVRRRLITCALD